MPVRARVRFPGGAFRGRRFRLPERSRRRDEEGQKPAGYARHHRIYLCEGDPLFYGSYMYMHNRLSTRYPTEIVPGVPSMVASAAVLGAPLVCRDEMLCVISGVLPEAEIERRLSDAGAAVIMKVGRNLAKVRRAVERAGLLDHAHYVERATMDAERVRPLADADAAAAPYFSMVVIPSRTAPTR